MALATDTNNGFDPAENPMGAICDLLGTQAIKRHDTER